MGDATRTNSEQLRLRFGPGRPSGAFEFGEKLLMEFKEVQHVRRRVAELRSCQGPLGPVGESVTFGKPHRQDALGKGEE